MANERNPDDFYRSADDPYRTKRADPDEELRRAARVDNDLQMDPELAEGSGQWRQDRAVCDRHRPGAWRGVLRSEQFIHRPGRHLAGVFDGPERAIVAARQHRPGRDDRRGPGPTADAAVFGADRPRPEPFRQSADRQRAGQNNAEKIVRTQRAAVPAALSHPNILFNSPPA